MNNTKLLMLKRPKDFLGPMFMQTLVMKNKNEDDDRSISDQISILDMMIVGSCICKN